MVNKQSKLKKNYKKEILDNYVVVTTVNKNYLKIFDLWYHYFESTEYKSILKVITIDQESEDYISEKSIETIFVEKPSSNFDKIVVWRFEIILNLLKQGKNIIQTDADAIWINPRLEQIVDDSYDIQISTEYGIPENVLSKWGFTLCTGFIIFHSNPNIISFVKSWIEKCVNVKGDQTVFNNLLLDNGIQWEQNNITKNTGFVKKLNLNIEAISYYTIGRTIEEESNISIFHPYLPSNNQNLKIIDLIKRLKLIDDDPFLDDLFRQVILNPKGWLISTIGWAAIIYHKGRRKLKERFN